MKRKSKRYEEMIDKSLTLYLEDVEEIFQIFKENFNVVSLETNDFELESVNEILAMNLASLSSLSFHGGGENYSHSEVYISKKYTSISFSDDKSISPSMLKHLNVILRRRKAPLFKQRFFLVTASMIVMVAATIISNIGDKITNPIMVSTANAVTIFAAFGYLFGFYWMFNGATNKIILKYHKDAPSFWNRNADKIILSVISTIIGLVLGYGFAKITGAIP